ncbi:hypothetical protein Rhopal_004634-T1 [Rhodotorula paludigena]|uniref:Cleavage and polyadenylation specificity factor subunit 5 n=1 Tax=Rhodotorula paludigena TaxID=86838 RepID=A0AAV5GGE4_9BASI|nr:hypothetical protein Rhopal_004634-T1 [Rhodotorula paludigena]
MSSLTVYPLSNYSFAVKEQQLEEDPSVVARLQRLESDYEQYGMRRTVEGLMIVHEHGHPHVLLLQVANAFFKLPGDYLKPHEGDIEGLQARMHARVGPEDPAIKSENGGDSEMNGGGSYTAQDWEVGDVVGQFWRPNFESFMYPYVPAHITKPKEVKTWHLIQLPERRILTVPKNMKLVALPLFELYDNAVRYGPQLASLPALLSRIHFVYQD